MREQAQSDPNQLNKLEPDRIQINCIRLSRIVSGSVSRRYLEERDGSYLDWYPDDIRKKEPDWYLDGIRNQEPDWGDGFN